MLNNIAQLTYNPTAQILRHYPLYAHIDFPEKCP